MSERKALWVSPFVHREVRVEAIRNNQTVNEYMTDLLLKQDEGTPGSEVTDEAYRDLERENIRHLNQ